MLAERLEPLVRVLGLARGPDHGVGEDLLGRVDRRELELLLRAEVCVEPALRHPDVVGEPADREAVEALERCELRRPGEDCRPRLFAVGAPALRRYRAHP